MQESLKAGHVLTLPTVNTIADGTAVKRPGEKLFPYIQKNVDDIITHRFDVRDFEKGFEAMNSGMSGKVILDWTKLEEEA